MPERQRFEPRTVAGTPRIATGQPEFFGSLSQRLQNFSGRMLEQHAQDVSEQSAIRGAENSVNNEGVIPLEDGSTIAAQSYNSVVRRANQNKMLASATEQLDSLEEQFGDDPETFNEAANGVLEGIRDGADATSLVEIDSRLQLLANTRAQRVQTRFNTNKRNEAISDLEVGNEQLIASASVAAEQLDLGEVDSSIEQLQENLITLVAMGEMTEAQADAAMEQIGKKLQSHAHMGQYHQARKGGKGNAFTLAFSQRDPASMGLSIEEHQDLVKQMDIIGKRDARILKRNTIKQTEEQKSAIAFKALDAGLLSGTGPIPRIRTSKEKALYNQWFEERVLANGIDDPGMRSAIGEVIRKTNLVPNVLKDQFSQSRGVVDPAQLEQLSELYQAVPKHLRPNNSYLESFNARLHFHAPEVARELTELEYNKSPEEKKVTTLQWTKDKLLNLENIQETLQDLSEQDIPVTPAMVVQFESALRDQALAGESDFEIASQNAMSLLQKRWAVSNINGTEQWMAHAPEAVLGVNDPLLRETMVEETRDFIPEGKQPILVPTGKTARQTNPTYQLMYRDGDHVIPVIGDQGAKVYQFPADIYERIERRDQLQAMEEAFALEAENEAEVEAMEQRFIRDQAEDEQRRQTAPLYQDLDDFFEGVGIGVGNALEATGDALTDDSILPDDFQPKGG